MANKMPLYTTHLPFLVHKSWKIWEKKAPNFQRVPGRNAICFKDVYEQTVMKYPTNASLAALKTAENCHRLNQLPGFPVDKKKCLDIFSLFLFIFTGYRQEMSLAKSR